MRLAAGMTAKFAVAGLPFGGGKAVLAVPRLPDGDERRALLRRYADLVCSFGGNYLTGCDMNTTPADLDVIAETCPHVFGHSAGSGEPGPFTARGVFHGIRASVAHVHGSPALERSDRARAGRRQRRRPARRGAGRRTVRTCSSPTSTRLEPRPWRRSSARAPSSPATR